MSNLTVSSAVDTFMGSANQVAMLAALANAGVFDYSTFTFKLPSSVQFATKTLTVSNSLTLAGDDGSTLNIGAGGTLGNAAFSGTSTGGNGNADLNKLLQYISGGVARGNAFFAINNSAGGIEAILAPTGLQFTNNGENSTLVPPAAMSGAWTWTLPDNSGTLLTSADFGTMAAQDADSVDITNGSAVLSNVTTGNLIATGGTMDGVVIGGSTPAAATFTFVECIQIEGSSNLTLYAAGAAESIIIQDGAIRPSNSGGVALGGTANTFSSIFLSNVVMVYDSTAPSTPTGSFVIYSISGQPHALDANAVDINISLCPQIVSAPSTATSTGISNQIAYDSTHFYVCIATNTWVRTALATW